MPITLRGKIGLTLVGFLLLVAGPIVLAYQSSTAYVRASDQFLAIQTRITDLKILFSLVQDLETSQRGYTLTGDSAFLAPYAAARPQLTSRLQSLRSLLSATSAGTKLADSLTRLVERKAAELDKVIGVRRTAGFDSARAMVAGGLGRSLMDRIREQVAGIDSLTAAELLAARSLALDQRRSAILGVVIAGLAALLLAAAAGILISRDITADRLAREQLHHAGARLSSELAGVSAALALRDERLRAIVDALPVALVTIDSNWLVSFWSPAAERMFGWTAAEVLGKPLPIVPAGREEEYRRWRESVVAGQSFAGRETTRVTRDGTELHVAVSTAALRNSAGESIGVVAAYVDMTAQRRLQEELRQSQKMEAVGLLAGGVAHDFNNLLTAILGFAGRVGQGLPPDDPRRADLEEIISSAESAAGLTRQLLTFSRPQSVAPKVMDVGSVVRSLEPMLRRLLGETIDLRCTLAPDSGRVLADEHHMEQVLLNLCINARDAMPKGGQLLIQTMAVELSGPYLDPHPEITPGPYSMLSVTDTGVGMDEAVRARIFEPFFTTKGGMGTGLGLATVYGIVKQAGGAIVVYSEPGRGSSFKVYLPRTDQLPEPPAPAVTATFRPAVAGDRVVVVEDNPSVRALTVALLEDVGFSVREFASAESALEALGSDEQPDLLITDLVLGSMDGAGLARALRGRLPDLPVIYMSGYTADTELVRQLSLQERVRFIDKPFRGDTLRARVAEILGDGGHRSG